jgi:hypothetical protein
MLTLAESCVGLGSGIIGCAHAAHVAAAAWRPACQCARRLGRRQGFKSPGCPGASGRLQPQPGMHTPRGSRTVRWSQTVKAEYRCLEVRISTELCDWGGAKDRELPLRTRRKPMRAVAWVWGDYTHRLPPSSSSGIVPNNGTALQMVHAFHDTGHA